MKFVVLTNSNKGDFEKISNVIKSKKKRSVVVTTSPYSEAHEYQYLLDNIHCFSKSDKEILLARFSGKESVVKDLGDECSEMIVFLSKNKNSTYYTESPADMFLDLVTIFERGD
jgi:hypothetical protein